MNESYKMFKKCHFSRIVKASSVFVLLVAGISIACGDTLVQEGFDYSGAITSSSNGGFGWTESGDTGWRASDLASSAAAFAQSKTWTTPTGYSAVSVSQGGGAYDTDHNQAMARILDTPINAGVDGTTYISLTFRANEAADYLNFGLRDGTGSTTSYDSGNLFWQKNHTGLLISTQADGAVGTRVLSGVNIDTDYVFLAKVEFSATGSDTISFGFFDSSADLSSEPVWGTTVASSTYTTNLSTSAEYDNFFFHFGDQGGSGQSTLVGNLRISDNYAGAVATAVPEPATYAMSLGVMVCLLFVLNRRMIKV